MPARLKITDVTRARRHVLSQQMYRLRRRYRYLTDAGLRDNAERIRVQLDTLSLEYDTLGGKPIHAGNVL